MQGIAEAVREVGRKDLLPLWKLCPTFAMSRLFRFMLHSCWFVCSPTDVIGFMKPTPQCDS